MSRQKVSLPLAVARIIAVSGMGLATAIAILLLVGGFWPEGLVFLVVASFFLALMLMVERRAERA